MEQRYPKTIVHPLSTVSPAARQNVPWFGVTLMLLLLLPFGQVRSAWGAAYHGQVVDAETGEPLKGAVVVVYWLKKAFISMNGGWSFHNVKEAVADAEGKFSVDASEGINFNPFTFVDTVRVQIWHPGYGPLSNTYPREFRDLYGIEEALLKGAVVKLPKLKTNEELRKFLPLHFVSGLVPRIAIPNVTRLENAQRKLAGLKPIPEYE
jgi:hypothetical protein